MLGILDDTDTASRNRNIQIQLDKSVVHQIGTGKLVGHKADTKVMKNGWSDQVIGVYLNIRAKFAAMVFEDTVPEFSGGPYRREDRYSILLKSLSVPVKMYNDFLQ